MIFDKQKLLEMYDGTKDLKPRRIRRSRVIRHRNRKTLDAPTDEP